MSRPTKVKVGFLTYTIKWTKEKDWPKDQTDSGGLTYSHNGTILIRLGDPEDPPAEDLLREILIHEILHAIWYVHGASDVHWKAEEDIEETAIRRLSPGLLDALRANPAVARYLLEK